MEVSKNLNAGRLLDLNRTTDGEHFASDDLVALRFGAPYKPGVEQGERIRNGNQDHSPV